MGVFLIQGTIPGHAHFLLEIEYLVQFITSNIKLGIVGRQVLGLEELGQPVVCFGKAGGLVEFPFHLQYVLA